MFRKSAFILCVIYSLNSYAINVHWGNTTTTTCESGEDIIVPTNEPTPQLGYHFVGWRMGLRQLEYLESTGTQYVNTGFKPTTKTSIETEYQFLSKKGRASNAQNGAGSSTTNGYRFCFDSDLGFHLGNNNVFKFSSLNMNWQDKHMYKLNAKNYTASIDNITLTTETRNFVGSDSTFYLFSRNADNNAYIHLGRAYYLQIWDNDILVRDMVPVLDMNGVACMYDKVENKLYYNSGTGNFIAGSIIGSTCSDSNLYTGGVSISNSCDYKDMYFYPVFEPNTLTLNWDYKDGRTEQTQCVYDTIITDIPENPTRQGYKFMGWRLKKSE